MIAWQNVRRDGKPYGFERQRVEEVRVDFDGIMWYSELNNPV